MIDAHLIAYAVEHEAGFNKLRKAGITDEHFVDEYRTVWRYISRTKQQHDAVPSSEMLRSRFPDLELPRVKSSDMPMLLSQIRQRRKFTNLLTTLHDSIGELSDYERVDEVVQELQGKLSTLAYRQGTNSHIVDLFGEKARKRMLKELHLRRSGRTIGIPTGLKRFDRMAGGLQKQSMVVVMGRPGLGKSWLDLLFVAQAVLNGKKVLLFPLEMTLADTAFRLYTLFSQSMLGGDKVLKNFDLTRGRVNPQRAARFLLKLENRFSGQLMVADYSQLNDMYTVERIDAETELNEPDLFWIDYITLMKPSGGAEGWEGVRTLSRGVAITATRRNCVGGVSAQVNREGIKGGDPTKLFLPRLEHLYSGDSIGQDAHQVFSINRPKKDVLYYALVKNRLGPEIGKTKVRFDVDRGDISEFSEEQQPE